MIDDAQVAASATAGPDYHPAAGPRLSFVIPCYNGLPYLVECLESIRRVAGPDCEAIVVDDGSAQDIAPAVEPFSDFARYVRQVNQGPAAARNLGIAHASGAYIAFMDADDYLISAAALAAQLDVLDARPEVGLVHAQALKVDVAGNRTGMRQTPFGGKSYVHTGLDEMSKLLFGNYITTSTAIVRRSIIERVGPFRVDLYSCEDWDLWLRIARAASVAYISEPSIAYRIHPTSITATSPVESLMQAHLGIVARQFEDPQVARRFGKQRHAAEAQVYARAARRAYRSGQMQVVRKYARLARRTNGLRRPRQLLSYSWLEARSYVPAPARSRLRQLKHRGRVALVAMHPDG